MLLDYLSFLMNSTIAFSNVFSKSHLLSVFKTISSCLIILLYLQHFLPNCSDKSTSHHLHFNNNYSNMLLHQFRYTNNYLNFYHQFYLKYQNFWQSLPHLWYIQQVLYNSVFYFDLILSTTIFQMAQLLHHNMSNQVSLSMNYP